MQPTSLGSLSVVVAAWLNWRQSIRPARGRQDLARDAHTNRPQIVQKTSEPSERHIEARRLAPFFCGKFLRGAPAVGVASLNRTRSRPVRNVICLSERALAFGFEQVTRSARPAPRPRTHRQCRRRLASSTSRYISFKCLQARSNWRDNLAPSSQRKNVNKLSRRGRGRAGGLRLRLCRRGVSCSRL